MRNIAWRIQAGRGKQRSNDLWTIIKRRKMVLYLVSAKSGQLTIQFHAYPRGVARCSEAAGLRHDDVALLMP